MKISKIQKGLFFATIAAGVLAVGCELIVDFDRTKIPVDGADATGTDTGVPDTGAEEDAGETPDADAGEAPDADAGESDADAGEPDAD